MAGDLRRGLGAGLAYGLAVAIVDLGFGTWNFLKNGLPAFTLGVTESSLLQILLGALLGLVTVPLRRAGRLAQLGQLGGMTALWLALARWVAVDPAVIPMWASPAVAGAILVLIGGRLGRRRPLLPVGIGVVALGALILGPPAWQLSHDADFVQKRRPEAAKLAPGTLAKPDVVVVVMDTVRAASVSAYGYGLETTPRFDRLAEDGALFLDASSPSTWSLPSHASLFTGLYPSVHGAHDEHRLLDDRHPTLAGLLREAGYQTVAFTANPWISDHLGLTRGFDWSDEAWKQGGGGRAFFFVFRLIDKLGYGLHDKGGSEVASHFEDWLASRPPDAQPAFAFLNFLEAHFPHHQLPAEFLAKFSSISSSEQHEFSRRLFATQFGPPMSEIEVAETRRPAREMYDAGVAYTDSLLGRVVEALRKRGSLDRTILVVLADHGEELGEHGEFGHGLSLYQPTMRVPLLIRFPVAIRPARVEPSVSTASVLATVVDLALRRPPPQGVLPSLLPVLAGNPFGAPVVCERFAEKSGEKRKDPLLNNNARIRAYRSGAMKLVETTAGSTALFDLAADPDETHDLSAEKPDELARVRSELDSWRAVFAIPELGAASSAGSEAELDPAAKERLKALGYVE